MNKVIKATNIYYFYRICKIGGIETFFYELAKKYHDIDLVIVYQDADPMQLLRLTKYVRCIKYTGQQIECEKAFFNFNLDIIDNVKAKDYCLVIHGNYKWLKGGYPDHRKLTKYYAVSKDSADAYEEITGHKVEVVYNPITKEDVKPVVRIVTACRLNDPIKGGTRTQKLIEAMDKYCKKHNRQYQLEIFSNPIAKVNAKGKLIEGLVINSPNVVFREPRLDIRPYIASADYVMSLSDNVEGYNYTNNESLLYGTPLITTPCDVYKELGMLDNCIVVNFDMSNIDEVVDRIFNDKIEVNYTPPKDRWNELLIDVKSNYKEDKNMIYKVITKYMFKDTKEGRLRLVGEMFECDKERYEYLAENGAVDLVETISRIEDNIEDTEYLPKTEETKKEIKKTTTKKVATKKK